MQVKKWLGTALALVLALGCLSGCGGKLPEGFSRDEVIARAKAASQLLEEEDYQGLVACWRPDLRDGQLEEKLRQALIISRGSFMTFIERPISAGLLVVAVAILVIALLPSMAKKRDEVFTE